MAAGIITTPSTWANGTVLTPTWAQSVQDSVNMVGYVLPSGSANHNVIDRHYLMAEDFDFRFTELTASGYAGAWSYTMTSNAKLSTNDGPGGDLSGVIRFRSDTDNTSSQVLRRGYVCPSTGDFAIRIYLKVQNYATISSAFWGFADSTGTTSRVAFGCASASAYWYYYINNLPAGTSSVAISNNNYALFEASRVSNTLNMWINGTNVYSASYTDTLIDVSPVVSVAGLAPGSTSYSHIECDYFGMSFLR